MKYSTKTAFVAFFLASLQPFSQSFAQNVADAATNGTSDVTVVISNEQASVLSGEQRGVMALPLGFHDSSSRAAPAQPVAVAIPIVAPTDDEPQDPDNF